MVRRTFPGLRADAIQLPHHGALSSAMGDFILCCSPKAGLVNAEEKDVSAVVQELARQDVKVYATPVTGAIMLRVDDHANMRVETFCACKPCRGREQTEKGP